MGKFARTQSLLYSCLNILLLEPKLLLFPLVSGICSLLVTASFIPLWDKDFWHQLGSHHVQQGQPLSPHALVEYGILFMFYFCNYFVITFFNTGLLVCVMRYMRGEDISIGEGFNGALSRIHHIIGWALVSAFVGVILRLVERRVPNLAAVFAAGLAGIAFSVASFLVVPVMVVEDKGPIDALMASGRLFRKTWGEQLLSGFSFGLFFLLISIPAFVLFCLAFHGGGPLGAMGITLLCSSALYFIVCVLAMTALDAIFRMALYAYAANGTAPQGFDDGDMRFAFATKKKGLQ